MSSYSTSRKNRHLAVFPQQLPPLKQLPEASTLQISVLKQLLAYHEIWHEKEVIYCLNRLAVYTSWFLTSTCVIWPIPRSPLR